MLNVQKYQKVNFGTGIRMEHRNVTTVRIDHGNSTGTKIKLLVAEKSVFREYLITNCYSKVM